MGSLLSIGSGKRSTNFNTKQKGKMSAERKISARKLSMDMQRKLSAISNCSDVSNLSVMLGMDPNDFKSTIQNILELDLGEDWPESEDESDLTESATGSQTSTDSLDDVEDFAPVDIDLDSIKNVLNRYEKHNRKISMTKLQQND